MKPPRPRPHLVIADEPLTEGKDYAPICSTEKKPVMVRKAKWLFEAELPQGSFHLDAETMANICCCRKCKTSAIPKGRYIYGAMSGEESKQEG